MKRNFVGVFRRGRDISLTRMRPGVPEETLGRVKSYGQMLSTLPVFYSSPTHASRPRFPLSVGEGFLLEALGASS